MATLHQRKVCSLCSKKIVVTKMQFDTVWRCHGCLSSATYVLGSTTLECPSNLINSDTSVVLRWSLYKNSYPLTFSVYLERYRDPTVFPFPLPFSPK